MSVTKTGLKVETGEAAELKAAASAPSPQDQKDKIKRTVSVAFEEGKEEPSDRKIKKGRIEKDEDEDEVEAKPDSKRKEITAKVAAYMTDTKASLDGYTQEELLPELKEQGKKHPERVAHYIHTLAAEKKAFFLKELPNFSLKVLTHYFKAAKKPSELDGLLLALKRKEQTSSFQLGSDLCKELKGADGYEEEYIKAKKEILFSYVRYINTDERVKLIQRWGKKYVDDYDKARFEKDNPGMSIDVGNFFFGMKI